MAKKRSQKTPSTLEWTGGIVSLPATVTDEGAPFVPDVLLWLDVTNELVVGSTVAHPDEILDIAPGHLLETMSSPAAGPPRSPTRVRVASEALAASLRAALPALEVVVAETPEVEAAGADLAAHLAGAVDERSWLADGLPPAAVGAFFEAMAELWRAAPWEALSGAEALISVSIEAFGVRDSVAVVIGELGESFGVLLFDSVADRDRFLALGMVVRDGGPDAAAALGDGIGMPAHAGLSFDPTDVISPTMRAERERHGWALADEEEAFPSLLLFGDGLAERAPTTRDLALAEALARAIARTVDEDDAFVDAWHEGDAIERVRTVETAEGAVAVVLGLTDDDAPGADVVPERVYRLKIELEEINWGVPDGEVSRTVDCPGDLSLLGLHDVIQQAFDWDDDHLFVFQPSGKLRDRKERYVGSPMGDVESWHDEPRSVEETALDDLGLKSRRVMRYVFDEHIVHKITVRTIRAGTDEDTGLPRAVEAIGEAPWQYGEPED